MLPPLIDIAPFRQALLDDQLILTPNHRLAAKIAESWAIEMQAQANVWRAPRVFSIDHLSFLLNMHSKTVHSSVHHRW